ncbi:hypothetical protein SVA_2312 [Sulfurifustis variabilis]|uniref:Uncharacterized protein n=1 Tax=Sulfurifustis variabilis TaxID=1675686 RepID=A0A1B4V8B5_9GAMM|nr:hypothetical protein SVA_2312 [Sulfurifustis variabilis]
MARILLSLDSDKNGLTPRATRPRRGNPGDIGCDRTVRVGRSCGRARGGAACSGGAAGRRVNEAGAWHADCWHRVENHGGAEMRIILLWLLGVPLSVIVLLMLFGIL